MVKIRTLILGPVPEARSSELELIAAPSLDTRAWGGQEWAEFLSRLDVGLVLFGAPGPGGAQDDQVLLSQVRSIAKHNLTTLLVCEPDCGDLVVEALDAGLTDCFMRPSDPVVAQELLSRKIQALMDAQSARLLHSRIGLRLHELDRLQALRRFVSTLTHDFNNLLTIVSSHCFIVMEDVSDWEQIDSSMKAILSASERASALSTRVLTYCRGNNDPSELVNLNQVLVDLKPMLETVLSRSVSVDLDCGVDVAPIDIDRDHLEHVIMNLAFNAGDAMPRGGALTLRTHTSKTSATDGDHDGMYTALTIRDTGKGMPAEVQARIFEPFFTTKDTDGIAGLGLSTVFDIVARYAGQITVDSYPEHGTTVTVYLPADTSRHTASTETDEAFVSLREQTS